MVHIALDLDVDMGLLCYLRSGRTFAVRTSWSELRNIIVGRNALAASLVPKRPLPPILVGRPTICQRCSLADTCMLFHKMVENGTAESSGLGSLFEEKTSHITDKHREYFSQWLSLIDMEAAHAMKVKQEMMNADANTRERTGR